MVLTAIPLAMAAGFFPAGLAAVIWYLSRPSGLQLARAYSAGAAVSTVGSGVALLVLLGRGRTFTGGEDWSLVGAVEVVAGAVALAATAAFLLRKPRQRADVVPRQMNLLGAFGLGLAMWTPSIAYVLAIGAITAAGLGPAGQAANLAVIDAIILLMAWGPLLVYRAAPEVAGRWLGALNAWLHVRARLLAGMVGGAGGTYLLVRGLLDLA